MILVISVASIFGWSPTGIDGSRASRLDAPPCVREASLVYLGLLESAAEIPVDHLHLAVSIERTPATSGFLSSEAGMLHSPEGQVNFRSIVAALM